MAFFSLGPPELKSKDFTTIKTNSSGEMVSRRKILSRSRDNLNSEVYVHEEEDVWYQKDKLFKVSRKTVFNQNTIIEHLTTKTDAPQFITVVNTLLAFCTISNRKLSAKKWKSSLQFKSISKLNEEKKTYDNSL